MIATNTSLRITLFGAVAATLLPFLEASAAQAVTREPAAHQAVARQPDQQPQGQQGAGSPRDSASIVAVVNGDIVSKIDVDNRRRLFALSTGMPQSPDVLDRLTPQVKKQLIDEKLRLQEIQRRKIVVSDKDISDAIQQIERQNNMPQGTLRHRLEADRVGLRTLIDQIRVQIGWTRVLREALGPAAEISPSDIDDQERIFKAHIGQPEYRVAEIFVPISDPKKSGDAERFAETIIQQLRAGAPFPVVAAQFSQSQNALQGGDLGWQDGSQFDPAVLRIVKEMPIGAVSNPIRVPGGISIVALRSKRNIGEDPATMLKLRQVFFPFAQHLDPANPTEQQKQALESARRLSNSAKSCDAMDEANKAAGSNRPADPGDVRLETVGAPGLRQVLASLPEGKASQPLIAEDGIAVVMVCSREQKNLGVASKQELSEKLLGERAELASRQLQRDLERRAVIDQRS